MLGEVFTIVPQFTRPIVRITPGWTDRQYRRP
jgi:hypothetical protein